jgi:copper homeostasis protein
MRGKDRTILEVIACSVADAVEAERGGASRLEVITEFESGGMTPPAWLVREILRSVKIPVRVMLRESEGYGVTGAAEAARLCGAARDFARLPVDGLVLGFSRGGEVDAELTSQLLSCAPKLKATFHHAFEECVDPFGAIAVLKKLPQIDRILTAGGGGEWRQRLERLAGYERATRPEISVLVGGGVDAAVIRMLRGATSIREFHVGRAVRLPQTTQGDVDATRVAELARLLEDAPSKGGRPKTEGETAR